MKAQSGVEWDRVDYGAGVFHVASFQDNSGSHTHAADHAARLEAPAEPEDVRAPDCFFYRCWSALKDCHRTA